MKKTQMITAICSALAISLVSSTGAHAASTNQVFVSGPLILLFLGFCALVVAIQCIPAMLTLYGMITGAAAANKEKATASSRIS